VLAFPWWGLVWLGAGVYVGVALGTLLVSPPANEVSAARAIPRTTTTTQLGAPSARSEPTLALTLMSTPSSPTTNVPAVSPPGEIESERTFASTDKGAGETQSEVAGVGFEWNGVVPTADLADADADALDESGGPLPAAAESDAASESRPAPSGVRMGTISNPVGFRGWALRAAPSTSARVLASLPSRTHVEILPDRVTGSGFTWVWVRTQTGVVGWVVANAVLR
jgi:hypothetical protein